MSREIFDKDDILERLRDYDIVAATATFSGSSDEGWITDIVTTPAYMRRDAKDSIEGLAEYILEITHPGWEINEGSDGTIVFDVVNNKITLEFYEHFIQSEYSEEEW